MWIDSTSWHKLMLCRINNQTKVYKKFILVAKRLKLLSKRYEYLEIRYCENDYSYLIMDIDIVLQDALLAKYSAKST